MEIFNQFAVEKTTFCVEVLSHRQGIYLDLTNIDNLIYDNYLDNKQHGLQRQWYDMRKVKNPAHKLFQLRGEENYLHGLRHGIFRWWYANGQLSIDTQYVNDVRYGYHREWFPNGQISSDGYFINGMEHGSFKQWAENGKLLYATHIDQRLAE